MEANLWTVGTFDAEMTVLDRLHDLDQRIGHPTQRQMVCIGDELRAWIYRFPGSGRSKRDSPVVRELMRFWLFSGRYRTPWTRNVKDTTSPGETSGAGNNSMVSPTRCP